MLAVGAVGGFLLIAVVVAVVTKSRQSIRAYEVDLEAPASTVMYANPAYKGAKVVRGSKDFLAAEEEQDTIARRAAPVLP